MTYYRIACLSTETVETLYALGAEDRIAGISGFTVRPERARREKPKISGFSSSRVDRILAVRPDLAIGFSDMQADICRELSANGIDVLLFNQRDIAGILRMVRVLSALVDRIEEGERLCARLRQRIDDARARTAEGPCGPRRPRIWFEEWHEPLISAIGWVSEMISLAGGEDVFGELAAHPGATQRIVADPMEVVRRAPDIIIGSWCGRKFQPDAVRARPGWENIPAVRDGMLFEIKSADILSPGPAAIEHGLPQLQGLVRQWQERRA